MPTKKNIGKGKKEVPTIWIIIGLLFILFIFWIYALILGEDNFNPEKENYVCEEYENILELIWIDRRFENISDFENFDIEEFYEVSIYFNWFREDLYDIVDGEYEELITKQKVLDYIDFITEPYEGDLKVNYIWVTYKDWIDLGKKGKLLCQ